MTEVIYLLTLIRHLTLRIPPKIIWTQKTCSWFFLHPNQQLYRLRMVVYTIHQRTRIFVSRTIPGISWITSLELTRHPHYSLPCLRLRRGSEVHSQSIYKRHERILFLSTKRLIVKCEKWTLNPAINTGTPQVKGPIIQVTSVTAPFPVACLLKSGLSNTDNTQDVALWTSGQPRPVSADPELCYLH